MSGINWALARPVDHVGALTGAFAQGKEMARRANEERALADFAVDPDNPQNQAALLRYNPEKGAALLRLQREREAWKRDDAFRAAMTDYIAPAAALGGNGTARGALTGSGALAPGGGPALGGDRPVIPNGGANIPGRSIDPTAPALGSSIPALPQMEGAAVGGDPGALPPGAAPTPVDYRPEVDRQTAAFAEMARADPVKALEAQKLHYAGLKERVALFSNLYDEAYEELGSVSDDAGYQRALDRVQAEFGPYGLDIRSLVPPSYPGPKGIRELRFKALTAKDQLIAADRYARLQWDIEDDERDNARADRNVDSVISDRNERRALTARRDARASEDRRYRIDRAGAGRGGKPSKSAVMGAIYDKYSRGERLTAQEQELLRIDTARGGRRPGISGGGGGGEAQGSKANPYNVSTPEEAAKLPRGAWFSAKGKLYQRPQ